jgi:hypothetical protein
LKDVKAAIDVDDIGRAYSPGAALSEDFPAWVAVFTTKAMQEALGRIGRRQLDAAPGRGVGPGSP